ncbi:MAG: type II secretion system protein GspL [Gammaproteobacteria bacterium SHHR-1]
MKPFGLILRLLPTGSAEQASWRAPGQEQPSLGTLQQAAAQVQGQTLLVLLPAPQVLLTRAKLPKGSSSRLRQALPYVLEEQLCSEVEQLHFALGDKTEGEPTPCAVIERTLLQQHLQRLAEAGLNPQALMAESQVWTAPEGQWRLLLGPEYGLLAMDQEPTRLLDSQDWPQWLQLNLNQAALPPQQLEIIDCRDRPEPQPLASFGLASQYTHSPGQWDHHLLQQPAPAYGFSLLQGDFSTDERLGRLLRPWRTAALLLILWLGLQLGLDIYEHRQLKQQLRQLDTQVAELFHQALPDSRLVNARVQMERALQQQGQQGQGDDLAILLQGLAPAHGIPGLQLDRLRYQPGELSLEVRVAALDGLDKLRNNIASQAGWQVAIQSATAGSDGVRGRLLVQRGQP